MTTTTNGGPTLKERASIQFKKWLKLPDDPIWYVGIAGAVIAAAGLLMPWLLIDDYPSAYGIVDLILFYPNHDDKWYIIRSTPLGTLTMLFAPIFITIFTIANAVKALVNVPSAAVVIGGLVCIIALAGLTGEITDPDRGQIAGWGLPHVGMIVTLLGTTIAGGAAIWHWNQTKDIPRPDGQRRKFEW